MDVHPIRIDNNMFYPPPHIWVEKSDVWIFSWDDLGDVWLCQLPKGTDRKTSFDPCGFPPLPRSFRAPGCFSAKQWIFCWLKFINPLCFGLRIYEWFLQVSNVPRTNTSNFCSDQTPCRLMILNGYTSRLHEDYTQDLTDIGTHHGGGKLPASGTVELVNKH